MTDTYSGWHFLASRDTLRDGSPAASSGGVERYEGEIIPCDAGLHASERALDALRYAPGVWLRRVELRGTIVRHGNDKAAASERHIVWGPVDATRTLHEFAIWCAEQALTHERKAGREPDPRSWAALDTKRRWLDGAATDAELIAAHAAARDAARAAAWAAAWDAAWDAAWAAAFHAARAEAARDAQNQRLTELMALAPEAPR